MISKIWHRVKIFILKTKAHDKICFKTFHIFYALWPQNIIHAKYYYITLPKKCSYLELFWSVFSRIPTEYREIQSISEHSVQMRENTDQKNSEYGHFLRSVTHCKCNPCKFFKNWSFRDIKSAVKNWKFVLCEI